MYANKGSVNSLTMKKSIKYIIIISLSILVLAFTGFEALESAILRFSNSYRLSVENSIVLDEQTDITDIAEEVTLIRVIDGDTIVVNSSKGKETVRFLLIDTPEIVHPNKEEEPFAKEASKFVKDSLDLNTKIWIERGYPETDLYERSLAYVWYQEENNQIINLNAELLLRGMARLSIYDKDNAKYVGNFKRINRLARRNKVNIWSIKGYVIDNGFNPVVFE